MLPTARLLRLSQATLATMTVERYLSTREDEPLEDSPTDEVELDVYLRRFVRLDRAKHPLARCSPWLFLCSSATGKTSESPQQRFQCLGELLTREVVARRQHPNQLDDGHQRQEAGLPKGQTPVIRVNNKRHGLSVISTVTNKGQMRWRIFDGALNTSILIAVHMRRLIKGASKKLFLILDNLRVHHAKPVKAWLAEHADAIEVFYLPSYSPELNPDEMANADIKQAVTKLAPARTKLQLVKATASHLRSLQRQPERIRKYFEHGPVRYARYAA